MNTRFVVVLACGVLAAVALRPVLLISQGPSLSGTWAGTALTVGHGEPHLVPITLVLTQNGQRVTGSVVEFSSAFDGVVTGSVDQILFVDAHVTGPGTDGICELANFTGLFSGSLKADLAQGTLVGNVVGANGDCLTEINRLTLQKQ